MTYFSGRKQHIKMFFYQIITILLFSVLSMIKALDNGLALTPPMGWMHWQRFRCLVNCDLYPEDCISEHLFRTMADHLATEGYLDAGYQYLIIDDCWMAKSRDNSNRLQPDPKRFPSGIKTLSDYVHEKGLKFGIYADFGTKTCAGYPGSLNYLDTDAKTFASWNVDYLKLDACYSGDANFEHGYIKMGQFLNETGRPIVYSCSWPAYQEPLGIHSNYSILSETCNLWRNWDDIDDAWDSVTNITKWFSTNQDRLIPFAGPGHWNDPDMLIIGNYGLSYEQSKSQMAIWALMAAPLIMSVDLRTIEPQFKEILLNRDVIGINQDPLGIQGRLVLNRTKIDIWTRPISPILQDAHSYAIGILSNRIDGYPYRFNFTLNELNITAAETYRIQEIFPTAYKKESLNNKTIRPTDELIVRVKPTGVVLLKVQPEFQQLSNDDDGDVKQ